MNLASLIEGLPVRVVSSSTPADRVELTDITDDSRLVTPGSLFIARPGVKADGKKFIADALAKGAAAVLVAEPAADLPGAGQAAVLAAPKLDNPAVAALAERFFGDPSRKLKLVGVTGTNGKTTITFVVQHLLKAVGVKAGVIGTVVIDDGSGKPVPADLTTPGAIDLSRHLARMVANGCHAAVMEVSSHALHQGRAAALRFDVAIFTNLTGDHLDYHGTMENYAAAKAILFDNLDRDAWAVVNADDPWAGRMVRDCKAKVVTTSVRGQGAQGPRGQGTEDRSAAPSASAPSTPRPLDPLAPSAYACSGALLGLAADASMVRFDGPWGSYEVRLPLVGLHNVMNVLQATAAANCIASLSRTLRDSLAQCPAPPGRLEPVRTPHNANGPAVLVDYAHTHDALENVLNALRPVTKGKLIVLFGCGGDRDRTKRPKMAAACCTLADTVVVTSDNPRTEDPAFIISQILSGVPESIRPPGVKVLPVDGVRVSVPADAKPALHIEPDRAKAIELAVRLAGKNDVVLLAGKGHEDYQIIGATKRHFDDREQAALALAKRG